MKKDVTKTVTIKKIAKNFNSIAVSNLFWDLKYWAIFVNIIGIVRIEIASIGSILIVIRDIAAAGKPIPRQPLIEPARTNVKMINIKKEEFSKKKSINLLTN